MMRWLQRLGLLLTALGLGVACSRAPVPEADWFERHRLAHEVVDGMLESGQPATAIAMLRGLLDTPPPAGAPIEVIASVRKDTYFRLADIHLGEGRAEDALTSARKGLALGRVPEDVFTLNLYIVEGRALESLGEAEDASKVYYEAVKISEKLFNAVLDETP